MADPDAGIRQRAARRRGRFCACRGPATAARFALVVVALTLAEFAFSSVIEDRAGMCRGRRRARARAARRPAPTELLRAVEPTFLVFVLGLGVVVRAASQHVLSTAIDALLPHGTALPALLAVAAVSAVAANLVNNLPATLIILPVAAMSGSGAVLAMLVGVDVGRNLTYVGSLATLLWRRIVHAHDQETDVNPRVRSPRCPHRAIGAARLDHRAVIRSPRPLIPCAR